MPRHLGQHSGGLVICQGHLDSVVPLEPASMPGRVVVQWDKNDCSDLGLIKVDLLGLGMMAVLEETLVLVREHQKKEIDLGQLPPDDPAVYEMLQRADSIGLFQVESRAQQATLPRLKPTNFYDLVVQVAIIRPGPIVGKMVHPYLARRKGDEPVDPLHPLLAPVLERTLGVPLFQEQLLRMAMTVANFTGRRGGRTATGYGIQTVPGAYERHRDPATQGHGEERHYRQRARDHCAVDHLLRVVWISGEPRSLLCPTGLCQRLLEVPSFGGLHLCTAE